MAMKYFRKHPDLLLIANYPSTPLRVRHGRQTTSEEVSKILVNAIAGRLRGKKILLLTDADDKKPHGRLIIRTCWDPGSIVSFRRMLRRLLYNFQTESICFLYHAGLFGRPGTILLLIPLLLTLRLGGKRVVMVFLTQPSLSTHPRIFPAVKYFLRVMFRWLIKMLTTAAIDVSQTRATRSIKERNATAQLIAEALFPSPTANLGLQSFLQSG